MRQHAQTHGSDTRRIKPNQNAVGVIGRSVRRNQKRTITQALQFTRSLGIEFYGIKRNPFDRFIRSRHRWIAFEPRDFCALPFVLLQLATWHPSCWAALVADDSRFGCFELAEHLAAIDGYGRAEVVDIHRRIKEREKLIIIFVRDRIEFVRVALRTAYGQPQPDCARRAGAIHDLFDARLFRVYAAFFVDDCVAMKARRHQLRFSLQRVCGLRQQITRKLFNGETIKRLVLIQRLNHPIAVRPHHALAINRVAVGIGIPRLIEPVPPPTLAIMRAAQQSFDLLFVGMGAGVLQKCGKLFRRWQQTRQIQTQAAQQGRLICHW